MNERSLLGAVLCVGGVLLSVFSYYSANAGGTYIMWPGAVVVGLIIFLKGWSNELHSKEHNEFLKRVSLGQTTKEDWNNKGHDLFTAKKYDDAIKLYDMAIVTDPEYKDAWINKGTAFYKLGKYDEANAAFNEVIRIDPQHADAWNRKAIVLKKSGLEADATAAFAKAKELGYTG
jgi:tetratricopeptide (TPR) repeat protein